MISRKIASFGLALSVLVSSAAIAYADENTKEENNDYPVAARTMEDAGMTGISAAALNHDPALNVALLADFDGLTLTQLTARAIVKEQEKLAAEEDAAREQANASAEAAVRAALLEEYDGVMVSDDLNVRKTPGGTVLRTINGGKVAHLEDAVDGWYKITYGKTTGYISADYAEPVHYADYEGTSATSTVREDLIAYAYTYLGTPYVYGGSSYSGTDCSGFTMSVFAEFGYSLYHGASDQYAQSTPVSSAEREAGDLVFFNTEGGISHVGLYIGGGCFIHASSSRGVTVDSLSGYYADCYVGAGRLLP